MRARKLFVATTLGLALGACASGDTGDPGGTVDSGDTLAPADTLDSADPTDTADPTSPTGTVAGTDTGDPTSTQPATTDASPGAAATVAVADSELGDILVDADGMTLYVFDNDSEATSVCADSCLDTWPPLLAEGDVLAGDGVAGELATFAREDGNTQVMIGGRPLYHFAADGAPGDVGGHGIGEVWWVVGPDGVAITTTTGGATPSPTGGDSMATQDQIPDEPTGYGY